MIRERGPGPRMQVAFKGWERQRNRFHSTASRSNSALFDALILVWKYLFKISDLQSDEITSSYQVTKYVIIRKQIHQVSLLFQVHKHGSAWSSGVSAPEHSCAVFFFLKIFMKTRNSEDPSEFSSYRFCPRSTEYSELLSITHWWKLAQ